MIQLAWAMNERWIRLGKKRFFITGGFWFLVALFIMKVGGVV